MFEETWFHHHTLQLESRNVPPFLSFFLYVHDTIKENKKQEGWRIYVEMLKGKMFLSCKIPCRENVSILIPFMVLF